MSIVEWLREIARRRQSAFGESGMEGCRYEEAAAEIERLTRERDEARAALRKIVDECGYGNGSGGDAANDIARDALGLNEQSVADEPVTSGQSGTEK